MTPEERARKVAAELYLWQYPGASEDFGVDEIAAAIRAAVEEEREACAQVADLYKQEKGMLIHIRGESSETVWETAAGSIASAIRGRSSASPPPPSSLENVS